MRDFKLLAFGWGAAGALALLAAGTAGAFPVTANYVDDERCDPIPNTTLTEEIGIAGQFPKGERLSQGVEPGIEICIPGDGNPANDWEVTIMNITGLDGPAFSRDFTDVFFVAAEAAPLGNADGKINGADAFRIDSVGVNAPLIFESLVADGIWQDGEVWIFLVTDYFQAPVFGSLGVPSGPLSESIVAIPEPSTLLLIGAGFLGLVGCGHRQARRQR